MTHNISLKDQHIFIARTADARGLVTVTCGPHEAIFAMEADVLLLRDRSRRTVVARFTGQSQMVPPDGDDTFELAATFCADPDGETLSSIIGEDGDRTDASPHGHEWGALGLPRGLDTRVSTVHVQDASNDEVAIALASEGYRLYASRRDLSLSPGDRVTAGSVTGLVVDLDRRTRKLELRTDDGATQTIGFDTISELEQYR